MIRKIFNVLTGRARHDWRFYALVKLGRWLMPEYRFHWPQIDWWRNHNFNDYLQRFGELRALNSDRRWMVYQLMRLIADVPGDTAECGVFQGAGSYLIARSAGIHPQHARTHFVFDSFQGLSAPALPDGSYWQTGDLACGLDRVKANLQTVNNVSWHQGWIPERFPDVAGRKFSFVHIDVDLYEPTRDSIQFFYPRMSTGGIIVCDDYGFTTCPGAIKAVDEFLADKPEKMISLPSGGGFLVKDCKTAPLAEL
jgi:O-methyltransferase